MNTDDIVMGGGTVRFSHERLVWHAGEAGVIRARRVTEIAPNGGVYMRLASAIEDEMLDEIVRLRDESKP